MKMKQWLPLLIACAALQPFAFAQTTYTLRYKNPNGRYPVCSTVKVWCGTGVSVGELTNGAWKVFTQSQSLSSSSYLFPVYPTAGGHTYGVWMNYKDGNGTPQQTVIDQVTVTVPPKGSQP
jgi:hypothetical protein